jgi:hypothetical protein
VTSLLTLKASRLVRLSARVFTFVHVIAFRPEVISGDRLFLTVTERKYFLRMTDKAKMLPLTFSAY